MREVTPEAALERLEALCARSEQCAGDLRLKLRRWKIDPATSEGIIRSLVRRRFVDDSRYARAFVRDKSRFDLRGRRWLQAQLMAKRIDRDIIDSALDEIDPDMYASNLRKLLRTRLRQLDEAAHTYEGRQKILRSAAARGYEPSLIISTLNALRADDATDD